MNSPSDIPHAPRPKSGHHPRNRHAHGYDFSRLIRRCPQLARFVRPNPAGISTIDFADPSAVMLLNRALLLDAYPLTHWDLPPDHLCPPIPGRADYLHHLADLLATDGTPPRVPKVAILDIGVGASCIFPIIGVAEYDWRFVGTDIDPAALAWARQLLAVNSALADRIELRLQRSRSAIFNGIARPGEAFAASICNPPFHASPAEAAAGTLRKLRNLDPARSPRPPVRNFGGRANELWCEGGEASFIRRMIVESAERPQLCRWFTTLVSKRDNLPGIGHELRRVKAAEVRTIDLAHGQKKSRIVAWRFDPAASRTPPRSPSARHHECKPVR